MSGTGGIAFFDLDRTLISVNSATGWIKREVRLGFMSRRQALLGGWWITKYHFGVAQLEEAIASAVATLEGEQEQVLRQRTHDFWHEEIRACIRPGARDAVARHRDAGDALVLLTSSSPYLSEVAAQELGLDDWLCNRFEVSDGVFTGRVERPLCFGPGKVHHAQAFADQRGLDLADCSFYTDSYSDLPGLLAVGKPVVVAPDQRLAREAKRRGWIVEDWGS